MPIEDAAFFPSAPTSEPATSSALLVYISTVCDVSGRPIGEVISAIGSSTTTTEFEFAAACPAIHWLRKSWACVLRNHTNV
jgi:hypothetical protein